MSTWWERRREEWENMDIGLRGSVSVDDVRFPIPIVWWAPRRFGWLRRLGWESHMRVVYGGGRPDGRFVTYHRTWREAESAAWAAVESVVSTRDA